MLDGLCLQREKTSGARVGTGTVYRNYRNTAVFFDTIPLQLYFELDTAIFIDTAFFTKKISFCVELRVFFLITCSTTD